eukprot:scaffold1594_cov401-Prasinococcus_capsulatus_cf.AAC.50
MQAPSRQHLKYQCVAARAAHSPTSVCVGLLWLLAGAVIVAKAHQARRKSHQLCPCGTDAECLTRAPRVRWQRCSAALLAHPIAPSTSPRGDRRPRQLTRPCLSPLRRPNRPAVPTRRDCERLRSRGEAQGRSQAHGRAQAATWSPRGGPERAQVKKGPLGMIESWVSTRSMILQGQYQMTPKTPSSLGAWTGRWCDAWACLRWVDQRPISYRFITERVLALDRPIRTRRG